MPQHGGAGILYGALLRLVDDYLARRRPRGDASNLGRYCALPRRISQIALHRRADPGDAPSNRDPFGRPTRTRARDIPLRTESVP